MRVGVRVRVCESGWALVGSLYNNGHRREQYCTPTFQDKTPMWLKQTHETFWGDVGELADAKDELADANTIIPLYIAFSNFNGCANTITLHCKLTLNKKQVFDRVNSNVTHQKPKRCQLVSGYHSANVRSMVFAAPTVPSYCLVIFIWKHKYTFSLPLLAVRRSTGP